MARRLVMVRRLVMARRLVVLVTMVVSATTTATARMLVRQSVPASSDNAAGVASVYLPREYDGSQTRYPVLVLLHGLGGSEEDWRQVGAIEARLDRAIASGVLPPLIAVMPEGKNGYWVDWPEVGGRQNGATGRGKPDGQRRFGSLVDPLVTQWADKQFRTNGVRAIAGVSMGGFGALSVALRNPSMWSAALSFSGALFTAAPTGKLVYWAAFGTPGLSQIGFPLQNPLHLARFGQADTLPIWLDCGEDDAPKFTRGLHRLAEVLRKRGAPHRAKLRPGGHSWTVWNSAFDEAMPWLGEQLRIGTLKRTAPY